MKYEDYALLTTGIMVFAAHVYRWFFDAECIGYCGVPEWVFLVYFFGHLYY